VLRPRVFYPARQGHGVCNFALLVVFDVIYLIGHTEDDTNSFGRASTRLVKFRARAK